MLAFTGKNKIYRVYILILLLFSVISACQNYPVKVNGNPLRAEPLFSSFDIEDKHLAACINEHIFDQHATKAEDLKQLNCAQRSIRSIKGIEIFSHLLSVKLNRNAIESINPLFAISSLEDVNLNDNRVDCDSINKLRQRGVKVLDTCAQQ